jgi:formylglycine-generating enzyme required for sulfatase activity
MLVLAGLAVGGWKGFRAWQAHQVRGARTIAFAAARVRIGNDARGRGWNEAEVEERPAHDVDVKTFELDVNEVTVAAYAVCVHAGECPEPAKGKLCTWDREDLEQHPINCVTHAEAERFCAWADKRLPTEVEWEYAAGGATNKRLFPWGDDLPDAGRANVCGAECAHGAKPARGMRAVFEFDDKSPATAPVGSYPAGNTPEGLEDMAGNVWEWTASAVCAYPDHDCPAEQHRIIRGGGWTHRYLLSPEVTTREEFVVTERSEGVGFRCAR